jgi:Cu-Zn family superoxide dismutase
VWLDFTTDASGNATATADEAWAPTGAQPRALVIHAEKTKTAAGVAGGAGARVSCLTVGK